VWDHLNHEIITAFDEEDVEELWMSDEEWMHECTNARMHEVSMKCDKI
jgi:hypothetical protein